MLGVILLKTRNLEKILNEVIRYLKIRLDNKINLNMNDIKELINFIEGERDEI